MSQYDHLDKDTLIRLLQRRDAQRQLGLVWERPDDAGGAAEPDSARNDDYVALDLDPVLGHGEAPWKNLVIEGDNFDALRALRTTHAGAIGCIYIDPPYNTGNRDFVYNDRFVDKTHRFRHSLWLEFMYQRLRLARDLLREDGVIFVSIDDNELFRLGMLMDRVFGEENKIGVVVWKNVTDNNPSRVVTEHEYVLAYARNLTRCPGNWKSPELLVKDVMLSKEQDLLAKGLAPDTLQAEYTKWFRKYKDQLVPLDNYKFIDAGGIYAGSRSVHNPGKEGYRYDVLHPSTQEPCTQPLMGYRFPEGTMKELLDSGRILFGEDHKKLIELKIYLSDFRQKLASVIDLDGRAGANEVKAIFSNQKVFNNPKPTRLISELISFVTRDDDVILDFFGGSGTTAQAVAKLNAEDGGDRRFILVSSTEATTDAPDKNLCRDVCAQRVRRVLGGYSNAKGEAVAGLGGGFAYLRARRIAPHRVATRIRHGEVWNALQLLHTGALSPWPGGGFACDGALGYLADFAAASVARLRAAVGDGDGSGLTLYSWAPERARALAPAATWAAIPDSLQARFGRRHP